MQNNDKKTFKELWSDTRSRAIIKLIMWFFFFFIIFLFLSIASLFTKNDNRNIDNKEEKIEEKVVANMITLLNNLIESNYTYEYKIIGNDATYLYNGTKEGNNIIGYYENNGEIIKYQVKDNIYYKLENDTLVEYSIISDENKNIIDLNNILNLIKEYENNNEVIIEEDTYIYNISDNYVIKIKKDSNNITSIEIVKDGVNYILTFKNIIN